MKCFWMRARIDFFFSQLRAINELWGLLLTKQTNKQELPLLIFGEPRGGILEFTEYERTDIKRKLSEQVVVW